MAIVPLLLSCSATRPARVEPGERPLHPGQGAPIARHAVRALGARYFPLGFGPQDIQGVDPGGTLRVLTGGTRVLVRPDGSMLLATDRLPLPPSATLEIPDRLGGGFLFTLGSVLWKAPGWLEPAKPIYSSWTNITRVVVGLDRIYVRGPTGTHRAFDPRTGDILDLGSLPPTPTLASFAALDGWHATAVGDLIGVVTTDDAGQTWTPLDLPIDVREVRFDARGMVADGRDTNRVLRSLRFDEHGVVRPLAGSEASSAAPRFKSSHALASSLGPYPILAAVESGVPLGDGYALVARDGSVARIRVVDGFLDRVDTQAFPLNESRCHGLSIPRALGSPDADAFFVCAEFQGTTALYAWDEDRRSMFEEKRFRWPRTLVSSDNGKLFAKGRCDPSLHEERGHYCVRSGTGVWRDLQVQGTDGFERLVPLASGAMALLAPSKNDGTGATLTVMDGEQTRTQTLDLSALDKDRARIFLTGTWLEGFEERREGVLGGWVESGGTFVGVEVDLQGKVNMGPWIRELGNPMVSGRYGLGWSASRRGYETVDGGMTWTPLDMPETLRSGVVTTTRACGPLGCIASGWARLGWGKGPTSPSLKAPPPAERHESIVTVPLALECSHGGSASSDSVPSNPKPSDLKTPSPASASSPSGVGAPNLALPPRIPSVVATGTGGMELSAFFDTPPPHLRDEEVGLSVDATDSPDHVHRSGLLARLYAWGPKLADWDHASQWEARWYFPFGNDARIRRTAPSAPPFASLDVARRLMGVTPAPNLYWTFVPAHDGDHGLLLGRRSIMGGEVLTLSLHHGLPIQEITRVDGEPFPDIESATFEGGRWYIATNQNAGELPATLVYEVDGLRAREMARIPRLGFDGRPPPVKLTRHSDGSRLGLVVDGPPLHGRSSGHRWILPLSFRGGPAEIPKGLGASDFTDRPLPKPCSADASGWIFDASYNASPVRITHGGSTGTLQNVVARLRVTPDSICTEGLSGTLDPSVLEGPMKALRKVPNRRETLKPTPMDSSGFPALWVHASGGHARHALRCSAR